VSETQTEAPELMEVSAPWPLVGDRVMTRWRDPQMIGAPMYATWLDVFAVGPDGTVAGWLQLPPNTTVPDPRGKTAAFFANQRLSVERIWSSLRYSPRGEVGTWHFRGQVLEQADAAGEDAAPS
jgi:hypothetical protein